MGALLRRPGGSRSSRLCSLWRDFPIDKPLTRCAGGSSLVYALGLELTDPGFDFTILSDFRKRLVEGEAEQLLLDAMLAVFKEQGWLKQRQRQRTDSTHVLAKVRAINRLMCTGSAMRFALNSLAIVAGEWLLAHSDPEWVDCYGHRIEESRLPRSQEERQALAERIGRDGSNLLTDLYAAEAPAWLREIPAVEILRRIWIQNYVWVEGQLRWRSNEDLPPGKQFINSPYDPEARYGKKRETRWTGYKVHITETCEEDAPHLITHVATTAATTTDEALTETIHANLQQTELTPRQHLLDSGYITAPILVSSQQQYGIEVIGPARVDVKWQANTEQGIDASQFAIDWQRQQAICPEGQHSISWTPAIDHRTNEVIKIKFSTTDCGRCPRQVHCIRSVKKYKRRTITIRPQAQHEALQAARRRQKTPACAKEYALREGIEATISEARAGLWHAPLPLYRPCQNALAASRHCRGDQCGTRSSMARWGRTRSYKRFCFPEAVSCSLKEFPNNVKKWEEPIIHGR